MMENMKILLPEKVNFIISVLEKAGYEAYAVGGCVRDSLLGRAPKDWDITTNALPEEVKGLFRRTLDTGLQHGTVTVMLDGEGFEVTTYRIDGKYEDGRHPDSVSFTRELSEDLLRRDFTINAMAYNETKGIVDIFDGQADLENKVIRAVGDPVQRFSEDALRIMRAARFASELDFEIENETLDAMKKLSPNIEKVSAERIRVELMKLIMGKKPEKFHVLYETGITKHILPEWDICETTGQECEYHIYNVADHIIESIKVMHALLGLHPGDREREFSGSRVTDLGISDYSTAFSDKDKNILMLAMLLHDIGKPATKTVDARGAHFYGHPAVSAVMANEIMHRLKFDNETIELANTLVCRHDDRYRYDWSEGKHTAAHLAGEIGRRACEMLIPVQYADMMAQAPEFFPSGVAEIGEMERSLKRLFENEEPYMLSQLRIDGRRLIELGAKPGKGMGIVLNELLYEAMEEPGINNESELEKRAGAMLTFGPENIYKNIFFDLDGTLTDSEEGIINCHKYALSALGVPEEKFGNLHRYIGPPLVECYKDYFDKPEDIDRAMKLYRERYNELGWKENRVYPGVPEMLERLKVAGHRLYVATSKPEHFAKRIIEYFGLAKYFDGVFGASPDDKRSKKKDVLLYALSSAGVELSQDEKIMYPYEALMVGDRFYDVLGASEVGMRTIGVLYGYGHDKELLRAGAMALAKTAEEILA